jgi:hypothetical protein
MCRRGVWGLVLPLVILLAGWTQSAVAAPSADLADISCAAPGECAAVGTASDSGGAGAVIFTQSGGAWSRATVATLPADAGTGPFSSLQAVSCPSAGACVATGSYSGQSTGGGLVMAQSAGTWGPGIAAPLPADAVQGPGQSATLSSVTCVSAGNCVAVGTYMNGRASSVPLAIIEADGVWSAGGPIALPADAPHSATTQFAGLRSVSCPSAGNCTAVGTYLDSRHHVRGLLVTERDGRWGSGVEARLPADAGADALTSPSGHFNYGLNQVSCRAVGECAVIGEYANRAGFEQGLLITAHRGRWSRGIQPTLPPNAATSRLKKTSVLWSESCTSPGNCTVAGWYLDRADRGVPLIVSQHDGAWQRGIEPRPPANVSRGRAFGATELESVSCASAGNCTAVGAYTAHGRLEGLLVTEARGRWGRGVEARLPANAREAASAVSDEDPALYGVSCAAAGSCSALGTYDTGPNRPQGMLLTQTGGAWSRAVPALF